MNTAALSDKDSSFMMLEKRQAAHFGQPSTLDAFNDVFFNEEDSSAAYQSKNINTTQRVHSSTRPALKVQQSRSNATLHREAGTFSRSNSRKQDQTISLVRGHNLLVSSAERQSPLLGAKFMNSDTPSSVMHPSTRNQTCHSQL